MQQQPISKKFNILQELEQAIKRKAVEKQRSREHTNKQLLLSIDKRRAESKATVPGKEKASEKRSSHSRKTPSKEDQIMKPFLLNNENAGLESAERKSVGKRLEKLFSLVNYTVSSAEKAIKFVNTANFEAEFAVKLFKSDRDSLLLEMETFARNEEEASRSPTSDPRKQPQTTLTNLENHSLKNENSTLKKQNLIAEAEISKLKEEKTLLAEQLRNIKALLSNEDKRERTRLKDKEKEIDNLLREIHEIDEVKRVDKSREATLKHNLFLKEKEMEKLKSKMREAYPLETLEKFFEAIEKETKFNMMLFVNFENLRKKGELEMILKSLEVERMGLEKKLVVNQTKANSRYIELRNYIAARVLPLLEGYTGEDTTSLTDTEVLEMFLRDVCSKQRAKAPSIMATTVLEKEVAQLKNQKASLTNQVEILKIQNSKDRSEQLKKASRENELLQANLEEIYDDLNGICRSAGVLQGLQEQEPDFQHLIQLLRDFVEKEKYEHHTSKSGNDPDRMILAVELATEKKLNREQQKQIQDLEQLGHNKSERIAELESDIEKLTRGLEKLQVQRETDRQMLHRLKDYEAQARRANDRANTLQEELQLRENTKQELLETIRESKKQLQASEAKLEKITRKEKGLEDTIQEMRKSQDFLKLQVEKLKQQKIASEQSLTGELEELKQALSKATAASVANSQENELEGEPSTLKLKLQELQIQKGQLRTEVEQLSKQKRALEKRINEQSLLTEELLAKASQESVKLAEGYKQEISNLNESLRKATSVLRQLEDINRSMEQEQITLLSNIAKLEKDRSQLEQQNRKLQKQASKLELKLSEAEQRQEEYTEKLERELKFVETQLKDEKEKNEQQLSSLAAAKQQLISDNTRLKSDVEALQTQLQKAEGKIQTLPKQVSSVQKPTNEYVRSLESQIEELRGRLLAESATEPLVVELPKKTEDDEHKLTQDTSRRYLEQIAALEQEVSKYKAQLAGLLTQQFSRDIQQINRLQKEHKREKANLNKRYSELEGSLSDLRNRLAEKLQASDEATYEVESLKRQRSELGMQLAAKEQELAEAANTLRILNAKQTEYDQVSKQLKQTQEELEKAKQQSNRAGSSRSSVDDSAMLLKKYIEEAEKEKAITSMKMSNYSSLVKSILKKIVDIEDIEQENLDTLLEKGAQKVFEWKKSRNWESSYKGLGVTKPDVPTEPFEAEAKQYSKNTEQKAAEEALNGGNFEKNMAEFEDLQNVKLEDSIVHEDSAGGTEPFVEEQPNQMLPVGLRSASSHQRAEETTIEPVVDTKPTSPSAGIKQKEVLANSKLDGETQPIASEPNRLNTQSSGGLRDFAEFKESSMSQSMLSDQKFGSAEPDVQQSQKVADLEEFADYKNDSMSNSMLSDKPIGYLQQHPLPPTEQPPAASSSEPAVAPTNQVVAVEDEFADYKEDSMSKSMMSEKNEIEVEHVDQQDKQRMARPSEENVQLINEDEFADFKDNSMHASMMSDNNEQLPSREPEPEKAKEDNPVKNAENDFPDFEQAELSQSREINQEDLNDQKPTEEKPAQENEGADFNDFGSYHNESLSKSQLSANLNQFQEFNEDLEKALDSSMLSENQFKQVNEANLHNILEGENIQEHDQRDAQFEFEDFIQSATKSQEH